MKNLHIFFWPLVISAVFFVISFFLSLSETALIGLSKIRLRHLAEKGVKNAKVASKVVSRMDSLITTILVGNNFVNTGISVIGSAIFVYIFGQKWGLVISTLIVTFIILVFVEITPKLIAAQHPERVSMFVARPISFLVDFLSPVANIFMKMSNILIKLLGQKSKQRAPLITEEELRLMIEVGKEEGAVSDEERKMLHKIFEFGDTFAGDVMVPKEKMAAISIKATAEELLDVVTEEGHSRIPVYKDTIDNVVGVIYARDLLHIWHNKGLIVIQDLILPAYFVGKYKKVNELLVNFQRMRVQIAIVVDDNKKTLGMVTLEDLIEEIVGEIEEEHR